MSMDEEAFPLMASRMPALFVGHGSPLNAIQANAFTRAWANMAASLPPPRAILCISAHWETEGSCITAMASPKTIHDFYGFPEELYAMRYPAPGSPDLARFVQATLPEHSLRLDTEWGLDHGTWSVLCRMYPRADIPVVQLSLDRTLSTEAHYAMARQLSGLRDRGILVLGSGNIVHNLLLLVNDDSALDWATAFDEQVAEAVLAGDHETLIHYEDLGRPARLSVPTNEHYLPLLYVLATQAPGESVAFFAEGVTLGSISMRSVRIG